LLQPGESVFAATSRHIGSRRIATRAQTVFDFAAFAQLLRLRGSAGGLLIAALEQGAMDLYRGKPRYAGSFSSTHLAHDALLYFVAALCEVLMWQVR